MIMIMTLMNMLLLMVNHPMSMGLVLIIQTIIVGLVSGMLMKTFWMSYILMITMLSGMLVLFIYMSSVAPNEKFLSKTYIWLYFLLSIIISALYLFIMNKMIMMNNYTMMEMIKIKSLEILFLNKMFNMENMKITLMMVLYLLMTMIVSSHLINISEGPMRMKKYV